ncbi:MAG: phenylalanine--tRNA ligase subunit beta [Candidatus Woesearchaeota archaeon]
MVKVELSIKSLEELVEERIEKIIGVFENIGISVEEITKDVIIVEVNSNRLDWLCVEGIAKTLRFFLEKEKPQEEKIYDSQYTVIIDKSVKKVRPYTACAVVDVDFDDDLIRSIIQLQEKLHLTYGRNRKKFAIGIYPADKIEFPITFFAENPKKIKFIPLNETREMNGLEILENTEKGKEYKHLLEGKEVFPFFKDSKNQILSMPPIINSELTGKVTPETKRVFIECSGFNLHYLKKALNVIIHAFLVRKAKVYKVKVIDPDKSYVTPDFEWSKIEISEEMIDDYLGVIPNLSLLEKMGYIVLDNTVLVPPYRIDIMHQVDIIEDLAIAYGYDNFELEKSSIETIGEESRYSKIENKIRELLLGLEAVEVVTFNITNQSNVIDGISLYNSVNQEYTVLRDNLFFNLLDVVKENKMSIKQIIFEIGRVFEKKEKKFVEREKVCVMLCNRDVSEARQILEYILDRFMIEYKFKECNKYWFVPGRQIEVFDLNSDNLIGTVAEIHPQILKEKGIPFNVVFCEFYVDAILY